ncbi:MAG TPA: VOC family protein [Stellaceae bacterium]|nr:VOC family protein [Stellaceae bacterium]
MTGFTPTPISAEPEPAPALDHVVVNARERLEAAADAYRRLGFHLTPPSRHTLGSINRLAVFERDYLELIGLDPDASVPRAELLRSPIGLNGLVFATESADALYRALAARAPVETPLEFSRPVAIPDGAAEARFRVVRVASDATPYGRVYFCQHLSRNLVWRDEWQHHPNGAQGIARMVIAAADPAATASLYRGLFGGAALCPAPGGLTLALGAARLDILAPTRVAEEFGVRPAGDAMAALTFKTASLDAVRRALASGGVTPSCDDGHRVVVAPDAAFGVSLEFVAESSHPLRPGGAERAR